MSSQNQCYSCQKLYKDPLVKNYSCKHEVCLNCLQGYKDEIRKEINNNKNRGNAHEYFKCPSYKTTMCPSQIQLQNLDKIFKANLKIHSTLINDDKNIYENEFQKLQQESKQMMVNNNLQQSNQNYSQNQGQDQINQSQSQNQKQNQSQYLDQNQVNQSQNQAIKNNFTQSSIDQNTNKQSEIQDSNKKVNYPILDFDEEVQEVNGNKEKLNSLYSTQFVKDSNFNNSNQFENMNDMGNRGLIQSSFPQCQMIQDDQFNQQPFNQRRLKQIIKNQQVVSNPQYQKSKYAPKNEEAISWDPKQFKQYQEMYNQAINILEKEESKKKLHITLYNDPHPQNEKIGEIETFRDFANKDCTSSDEKLEIAKSYTLIGSRKPIRGDGNCFYRAVISQLLEKIFIGSYANRALKLLGQIIDEKEFQIIEVLSDYINETYLNQLTDLVRLNLISKIVYFIQQRCDLEQKVEKKKIIANIISKAFNQENCNFDFSAVVLGRSYGALALQLYGQSKEYRDFCHDQEQLLQILYIYGQDVESTIIPIITETLDISLKIHNFEKVKNKWDIYGQEYKPKCYTVNLNEKQNQEPFMHHYIDVLLHQGHYQSIFTPNYTKNVYGTLKDKVKDFDRVEHERLQREKLLRSQFKIKVEFDTCLLCNNQKLTANTKQCGHRYCAQCLQKMVTFLEENNFSYYNCHYRDIFEKNCTKQLLLQEFLEMLEQISIYQQKRQELREQTHYLQKKCCRCKTPLEQKIFIAKKCNHLYCDQCIEYIYNQFQNDDQLKIQQCRHQDQFGNKCHNSFNEEDILEMIAKN